MIGPKVLEKRLAELAPPLPALFTRRTGCAESLK